MENVGVLIGLILNVLIVSVVLAVAWAVFNGISKVLKLNRNNDQIAIATINKENSFKLYPTTYQYNTYLTKESALDKLKECSTNITKLEDNVYFQLIHQGEKLFIIPQHWKPERVLKMKIEVIIKEIPGNSTTVNLIFKFTSLMEWLIKASFVVPIFIFSFSVISKVLDLELGIEVFMWPSLIFTFATLLIILAQYYANIGRYLKLIKRIHGL